MLIEYQNLLEQTKENICFGTLSDDGIVTCLCGCDGTFEPEDYKVLHTYPGVDVQSMIRKHIKQRQSITLRESLCADFEYELNYMDDSSKRSMDDSFQYMWDQLEIQYQNREKDDLSISQEGYAKLRTILEKESESLRDCYFRIHDLLSK